MFVLMDLLGAGHSEVVNCVIYFLFFSADLIGLGKFFQEVICNKKNKIRRCLTINIIKVADRTTGDICNYRQFRRLWFIDCLVNYRHPNSITPAIQTNRYTDQRTQDYTVLLI